MTTANIDVLQGAQLIVYHLYTLAVAAGMIALAVSAGLGALRVPQWRDTSAVLTLLVAAAVGTGVLGTSLLIAFAIAGVNVVSISLVLITVALLVRRRFAELLPAARGAATELRRLAGVPVLSVLALVTVAMLMLALAPPTDYDSLMYHLEVPRQFLLHGGIHVPDGNMHASYVGLVHMLYLPLLAVGSLSAPALLSMFFTIGGAAAMAVAADEHLGRPTGSIALVLYWGSAIVLLVGATPKVDVTAATFGLLGHLVLLRAITRRTEVLSSAVVAGALLGFAVGVKHLSLAYIAVLVPVAAYAVVGPGRLPRAWRTLILPVVLACAVAMLPWIVKNQVMFGAPLYPDLAEEIPPQWVRGFPGWETARLADIPEPLRVTREPFSLRAWLMQPETLAPEGEGLLYGANPAFAFVLLAPLFLRSFAGVALVLPGVLFILVIVLRDPLINLRYLIPAIAPLTIGAAFVAARIVTYVRDARMRVVIFGLSAGAIIFEPMKFAYLKIVNTNVPAYLTGAMSRQGFMLSGVEVAGQQRLAAALNQRVPADARILMLFESRGFGINATVLQDNLMRNWSYLDAVTASGNCFDGSGITHVVVAGGTLEYLRFRGLDPVSIGWDRFDALASSCLEPWFAVPGYGVYRVRDRISTNAPPSP